MVKSSSAFYRYFILCWSLLSLTGGLHGQSFKTGPPFYSIEHGLSSRSISDMHIDNNDQLWVATDNGLNKFDGYQFVTFSNYPSKNGYPPLSESKINKISSYKDGRLVITYKDQNLLFDLFDPGDFTPQQVKLTPDQIKGMPRNIITDPSGEIYVTALEKGFFHLYHYIGANNFEQLISIADERRMMSAAFKAAKIADDLFLLYDPEKGLRVLDVNAHTLEPVDISMAPEVQLPSSIRPVTQVAESPTGKTILLFQGLKGLYEYNIKSNRLHKSSLVKGDRHYRKIWSDQSNNLLLLEEDGREPFGHALALICLDSLERVHDFSYLLAGHDYIIEAEGKDFMEKVQLSSDAGLHLCQNRQLAIQTYFQTNLSESSRGVILRGIEDGPGEKIFITTENDHLFVYQPSIDQMDTLFYIDEFSGDTIPNSCGVDIKYQASDSILWSVVCQPNGGGNLLRYDLKTGLTRQFLNANKFTSVELAQNGKIWLGADPENTGGALFSFDPITQTFNRFLGNDGENPFRSSTPRYVLETRDHMIWVGTEKGLFRLNPITNEYDKYLANSPLPYSKKEESRLLSSYILLIYEDDQNRIWLGTTNGFQILDPVTGKAETFTREQGLSSNLVCGIVPDDKGNFWLSTYSGLSCFDVDSGTFKNFFQADGLTHNEFNRFSFHKDQYGQLYFGGVNGLNVFTPEEFLQGEPDGEVVLTRITRFNKKSEDPIIIESGLFSKKTIELPPTDLYLQLHFALQDFTDPNRNQYSAWLEGYEKDYNYLGSTNHLRYNRLPAGKYTLHINAADAHGNWTKDSFKLNIVAKQHTYEKPWFWVLLVLAMFVIAFFVFKEYLDQRLREQRLRTQLSSDLHDEVSGLLSGIAMQSEVLQQMNSDEEQRTGLARIGEASRKAMTKMSDVIWSIDARRDKVMDLLQRMREHADDMLLPLGIRYNLDVVRLDEHITLKPQIRQEVYFIYKEAINNVVKHADANEVQIRIGHNAQNRFELSILDNGTGNPTKQEFNSKRKGQGLKNLRMRAQRLNADLKISNGDGYQVYLSMKKIG